jgi:ribosomal-protein-alanine N-acetyltransferase
MAPLLRAPTEGDRGAFLVAVRRSRDLHHPWTAAPDTDEAFDRYLERAAQPNQSCRLVVADDGELVGVYNLSEIVRGVFLNAYLGYYAFAPLAGTGLMRAAMPLVFAHAFEELELHRLQASVQPGNDRSRRLLEATGWREEGFSPRYLFIDGAWRDHVHYAITAEDVAETA